MQSKFSEHSMQLKVDIATAPNISQDIISLTERVVLNFQF